MTVLILKIKPLNIDFTRREFSSHNKRQLLKLAGGYDNLNSDMSNNHNIQQFMKKVLVYNRFFLPRESKLKARQSAVL